MYPPAIMDALIYRIQTTTNRAELLRLERASASAWNISV